MMLTYLGQVTGKREPLDLSETCRKILVTLKAGMPRKVVLETDMPAPGPTILADAKHIQQVLSSLVTNAWESAADCMEAAIHLTIGSVPAADIPVGRRFPINWQPKG
jgi:nitrogen-specific signal transduction histidine kinase